MKKVLLVFTLVVATAVIAEGADWKLIGLTQSDSLVYYDVSSIKEIKPGIVQVWEKRVWTSNYPLQNLGKPMKRKISLELYDCSKGKGKTLQVTGYFVDGTVDSFQTDDLEWFYIIPDTMTDAAYKLYCDEFNRKEKK